MLATTVAWAAARPNKENFTYCDVNGKIVGRYYVMVRIILIIGLK